MDLRFCDLGLKLDGSILQKRIDQLFAELADHNIHFRPTCWLSSEWFSPDDFPGIAVPFYLAHRRLAKLEDRLMLEVEGGTKSWCMKLLRHEAGHAVETAYCLNRRARWRKLFGKASKPYPDYYSPRPFSRKYVLHLDWWYAQSHPTEDFAETFAVWLKPGNDWRRRYKGWPALAKLEYLDQLMKEIAGKKPPVTSRARERPLHRLRQTLREHYREKREHYGTDYPDFYDSDLRRIFSAAPEHARCPTASSFLRRVGPKLRDLVSEWTSEHPYTIHQLLNEMVLRSRELDLRVHRPAAQVRLEVAILLTMQTTHYLHSGDHRFAV